jgi:hypothetical protein
VLKRLDDESPVLVSPFKEPETHIIILVPLGAVITLGKIQILFFSIALRRLFKFYRIHNLKLFTKFCPKQ